MFTRQQVTAVKPSLRMLQILGHDDGGGAPACFIKSVKRPNKFTLTSKIAAVCEDLKQVAAGPSFGWPALVHTELSRVHHSDSGRQCLSGTHSQQGSVARSKPGGECRETLQGV